MAADEKNVPGERFSGRWIMTLEGYRAFYPNPLPPRLDWSASLAATLSDASIASQLCERGILPAPLLYLSAFFEATRADYYAGLRAVSEQADWEAWVQYFLNGVARQSEDALSRAERPTRLLSDWRTQLAGQAGTKVALQLLDQLGANPFITPRGAEQKLGLAYNTISRAIGRLEKLGVVKQVSEARRDRVYCAGALLAILEEPARLTPAERL